MTKRKWLYVIVFILLSIPVGGYLFLLLLRSASHVNIDKNKFPVSGIDISEHTGKVDFGQLKTLGIDFVYIKATEGATYTDKRFEINSKGVKQSGLPYGFYHFFRFRKSGKEQANNFLNKIRQNPGKLPPVIDVEEWGNQSSDKNTENLRAEIRAFIDIVGKKLGTDIMIYTNPSTYHRLIEGHFDNKIWICAFTDEPDKKINWQFWQHSHYGSVKGVEGNVDLNTFKGARSDWTSFLQKMR